MNAGQRIGCQSGPTAVLRPAIRRNPRIPRSAARPFGEGPPRFESLFAIHKPLNGGSTGKRAILATYAETIRSAVDVDEDR